MVFIHGQGMEVYCAIVASVVVIFLKLGVHVVKIAMNSYTLYIKDKCSFDWFSTCKKNSTCVNINHQSGTSPPTPGVSV